MNRLTSVKSGKQVVLVSIAGGEKAHCRLAEMGLTPGQKIEVLSNSGFGPVKICFRKGNLALGHGLAQKIMVEEDLKNGRE